jgi:hypothetical protein
VRDDDDDDDDDDYDDNFDDVSCSFGYESLYCIIIIITSLIVMITKIITHYHCHSLTISSSPIIIMIGTDMGAGHSKLSNRYQYLSACFWSFYADFPHIVVAVKSKEDQVGCDGSRDYDETDC